MLISLVQISPPMLQRAGARISAAVMCDDADIGSRHAGEMAYSRVSSRAARPATSARDGVMVRARARLPAGDLFAPRRTGPAHRAQVRPAQVQSPPDLGCPGWRSG